MVLTITRDEVFTEELEAAPRPVAKKLPREAMPYWRLGIAQIMGYSSGADPFPGFDASVRTTASSPGSQGGECVGAWCGGYAAIMGYPRA